MRWMLLLAVICAGCGPTWSDVIRHPDGTIEDPSTGECWRYTQSEYVPVACPSR